MRKKILICSADEAVRESLKSILGNSFEMILTESALQCGFCLERAKDVGLILLDHTLTGSKDTVISKHLAEKFTSLPIISISGYEPGLKKKNPSLPRSTEKIANPFNPEEILSAVKKCFTDQAAK